MAEGFNKHFLRLPFPAFGYITPLLELSRKVVKAGHRASLATSESLLNDRRSRKMMTLQDETTIHFVRLDDGVQHVFDEQLTAEVL
ncbi:hypothetical protein RvY_06701 [Ramazzottius varieornatus]|uniref:Uncharacterized protein n=1 Tax=Ramazzottius varieornatus TaxID=947166 RepID=A0A1D1V4W3_RAMVA|nr:hypothetical protein RvY_06701 [Ramazzottius varieornatus]